MRALNRAEPMLGNHATAMAMPPRLEAVRPNGAVSARLVCRIIAGLGQADFKEQFAAVCCELADAEQLTAFAIEGGRPRSILAFRPRRPELVDDLCQLYTSHYHVNDAFLNAAIKNGGHYTAGFVGWSDIADNEYRRRFFTIPGLHSKYAVVTRHGDSFIYLNLYFKQLGGRNRIDGLSELEDYGKLLAEALSAHDDLTGGPYRSRSGKLRLEALLRQRFPILSPREVQVCARIVGGYSVEGSAIDLAISSTTVTTFRRRAYAKLGISSQNELFACCVGVT